MIRAKIAGLGKYIPHKVLTNHDLERIVDTSDDWIISRTGIKERHIAALNETSSSMGAEAAKQAIKMAQISKEEIDFIVFATMTPDMPFPASACLVQEKLKIPNAGTTDIEAACSGFIYGLSLANAYIVSGMYKNVLVIGSDAMSRVLDWKDRNTCVLFGDGAGAAVVTRNDIDESGFNGFKLHGDGSYKDLLYMDAGGSHKPASHETVMQEQHYLRMKGNSTFKVAVKAMTEILQDLLDEKNISINDIKYLIPHQANARIISGVAERLDFPMDRVFINLSRYGNTSSATIPIALTEVFEEGKLKKGDLIAFVAIGGGFTWGASILKW